MKLHTLRANGLSFAYYTQGEGPLVLCLHGFPDTANTWDATLPILAERGYRVVAPFMRGYAPTEIPASGSYSVRDLGEDVLGMLDALGEQSAILIGHDWGASAVYAAAALAPERVDRLVVLAIPPVSSLRLTPSNLWGARHFLTFLRRKAIVQKVRAHNFAYLDEIYRRWSPTWSYPPEELDAVRACFAQPGVVEAAMGYYWSFSRDARNSALQSLMRAPIRVPTLLFGGEDDGALKPSNWARVGRSFDAPYRVVSVPKAGHFVHREAPEYIHEALCSWLEYDPA